MKKKKITIQKEVISRETYTVDCDFIQMYKCVCTKLAGLTPCDMSVLIFSLTFMDTENYFVYNERFRERFAEHCRQSGIEPYVNESIQKALANLRDRELLISEIRGQYRVNVVYFWKDTIESRKKELNKIKKNKKQP